MSQIEATNQSTWHSKIKAMGPGILMASAAVGGSHIVSSTQAGASYGWALLGLVILANVFKYPFFRFGAEYTADTGKTLVEGYAKKGKFYLWVFFILNVFSALVNTAGVSILCSAIIASAFPMLGLSITTWSIILVAIIWGMLLFGGYKFLDGMAKWIMSALTIATVAAVVIAAIKHPEYRADFVEKSPWQLVTLPFIVSLLGWMPAPIEISAINSLWSAEKKKTVDFNSEDALFDFNVGYIGTVVPKDFTIMKSIDYLIIAVLGGLGSITGTILAAIVLGILNMFLQNVSNLRMIIYALALILVMLFRPGGLLVFVPFPRNELKGGLDAPGLDLLFH